MEYRVRKRDANGTGRLPRSLEEAIPDAVVRRFLLRAGFRSSSDRANTEVRRHVNEFFHRIVGCMVVMMQHDRRRSFRLIDVKRACEHFGIRMYGYDDMCLLAARRFCGPEVFHVTELVECNSLYSRPAGTFNEPDTEPGAQFHKTDFLANYTSWKEETGDIDDNVSELSEWEFSDSDSESQGSQNMDTGTSQSSQPDEEKFMTSLQAAQQLVDEKLLLNNEDEDADFQPGQGYYSDYDDGFEPNYMKKQRAYDKNEEALWIQVGELYVLQNDRDSDIVEMQDFVSGPNFYVISRQEYIRLFRSLMSLTLNMGELQISSVALSALHNATEQCLHRSLTEGSLRYQLAAILMEQEQMNYTNQLEKELQIQHEKVNELCEIIAVNKAAVKAKELAMQRQIDQLTKQISSIQETHLNDSTSKKLLKKRKTGSALRSRCQNQLGTKKAKISLV
ncbi:Histone-fold [Plasmopara halstedii]|uniref:Histone-fold n=1 Tax=Plasmopara halstedii TaxID=4781 RepID=A0A0P1AUW8_PLAHL|nr:Histone-fold [Plasmopara halstedii]CEG44330.1 Histone-fold [Plasmopara halstedii]|eukprot:XP_024580699.1 Histone-fold [Plasmopara halstedii]